MNIHALHIYAAGRRFRQNVAGFGKNAPRFSLKPPRFAENAPLLAECIFIHYASPTRKDKK
jgi:hypothetical protein